MFIKWRHEGPYKGVTRWYAYLAESKRVDGKPRQKVIAYLASIEQRARDSEWIRVDTFWYEVTRSLCLTGVGPGEYSQTMHAVGKRVPLPTYQSWCASIVREHEDWIKQHSHLTEKARKTDESFHRFFSAYQDAFIYTLDDTTENSSL